MKSLYVKLLMFSAVLTMTDNNHFHRERRTRDCARSAIPVLFKLR